MYCKLCAFNSHLYSLIKVDIALKILSNGQWNIWWAMSWLGHTTSLDNLEKAAFRKLKCLWLWAVCHHEHVVNTEKSFNLNCLLIVYFRRWSLCSNPLTTRLKDLDFYKEAYNSRPVLVCHVIVMICELLALFYWTICMIYRFTQCGQQQHRKRWEIRTCKAIKNNLFCHLGNLRLCSTIVWLKIKCV